MLLVRILLPFVFLLPLHVFAQRHYLISLKDKGPEAAWLLKHPEEVLSPKALERRQKAGVALTTADLPISQTYLKQLRKSGLRVVQKSKWLNLVLVRTCQDEEAVLKASAAIAHVRLIESVGHKNPNLKQKFAEQTQTTARQPFNYGAATDQIFQLNLNCLHDRGYTGTGVLVAQFDSGWEGVDTLSAFDSLRNENRILATRNFVNPGQTVYNTHSHGTIVLSTIAANLPGQIVGGAPRATFALALTEDVSQEVHQEELNWAAAAEWADSLGADIITSSLGYKEFDFGQGDYSSADLNGDLAIVTRAADLAASRGILVVTSAGNSGLSGISAPCDGDSVLCVGAIDINHQIAGFSSIGPTGDGRIKPDVVALGVNTQSVLPSGAISGVNGTSLSCPLMAALVTCLKQAHPGASNMAIIEAVKQSADQTQSPDIQYGWGLPDACKADSLLQLLSSPGLLPTLDAFTVQPTMASSEITVVRNRTEVGVSAIEILTITGQRVQRQTWADGQQRQTLQLKNLAAGMYLLSVRTAHGQPLLYKFVKQ